MSRAIRLLVLSPVLALLPGCTDLKESPTSAITPDNFYKNEAELLGGIASVYAQLHATTWSYYNLSQVTSDEHIIPTRGSDWYDNGRWLELDRQGWGPGTGSGLEDVGGAWNDLFQGVARANVVLSAMANIQVANKSAIEAELRTLRAFYYYMLMDLFGGVPIVTTTEIKPTARATRKETFEFIESELKAALPDLPTSWPSGSHGRLTKGAANAILASMYVNAEVWTGEVTATGLTKGPARWADAVTAADAILNAGTYSLATDWRSNFTADNSASPENILVVKFAPTDGQGLNFVMRALHYSQFNPSPWNGFATIAEVYNKFDTADQRLQIFLVGPQNNLDPKDPKFGQPVNDRSGQRLNYTVTINNPEQATEGEGARILKWPPDPNHVNQENGNDFAYFRLAEIYLIKAEALNEQGQTAQAMSLVNTVRARAFNPPKPLAGLTQAQLRQAIFDERLFELTAEAKRRQDQIRAGTYTASAWFNKPTTNQPYRIVFSIPRTQLETNPLLTQNPGY